MRLPRASGFVSQGVDSGRLIVIKLAVTEESPIDLRQYQATDRRFPHHPTWLQVYGHARVDAYRRLGYANAQVAAKAHANGQTAG